MSKSNLKYLILLALIVAVGLGVYFFWRPNNAAPAVNDVPANAINNLPAAGTAPTNANPNPIAVPPTMVPAVTTSADSNQVVVSPGNIPSADALQAAVPPSGQPAASKPKAIAEPIADALARVTKKPFGIKILPGHSPVSPEKFSGYHTGVDFEAFPAEQNIDVPIYAICDGTLAVKEYATGYGGVAVERCQISGADVMVIYGHLRLESISPAVGESVGQGQQIAVLGTGYGTETDGERKHLHLGIRKGKNINILGYVAASAELNQWIDAMALLQ